MLGTRILTDIAAMPNVTRKPRIIKVADLALGLDGKPSLNRPCTKKINPINIAKSVTACIPSRKVGSNSSKRKPNTCDSEGSKTYSREEQVPVSHVISVNLQIKNIIMFLLHAYYGGCNFKCDCNSPMFHRLHSSRFHSRHSVAER